MLVSKHAKNNTRCIIDTTAALPLQSRHRSSSPPPPTSLSPQHSSPPRSKTALVMKDGFGIPSAYAVRPHISARRGILQNHPRHPALLTVDLLVQMHWRDRGLEGRKHLRVREIGGNVNERFALPVEEALVSA